MSSAVLLQCVASDQSLTEWLPMITVEEAYVCGQRDMCSHSANLATHIFSPAFITSSSTCLQLVDNVS